MRKDLIVLLIFCVVVVVGAVVGATYYQNSLQKTQKPVAEANQRLVRPDSPTKGPADAKVTVVEFFDPECESCRAFEPAMKRILKDYDGKVRLVVRYMPLHPNSKLAASYIEAAKEQGKFWEMLELLFERQPEWGDRHGHGAPTQQQPPEVLFKRYAGELGLDLTKVQAGIASKKYDAKIEQDFEDGRSVGVERTPTFFVNNRELVRFGESYLRELIEEELKK